MLRLFCIHHNYEVVEAVNGQEALAIIEIDCPDLVIIDIWMPGIDGFDTVRQIREKFDCLRLPVLFFTSRSDARAVKEGLALGAQGYLSKPTSLVKLLQVIEELTNDQRPETAV